MSNNTPELSEMASIKSLPAQNSSRKDLIIYALQEQIATLSGQGAGYRADLTIITEENAILHRENADLTVKVATLEYEASLPK